MKNSFKVLLVAGAALTTIAAMPATAQTYVGSWTVDSGPDWPSVPTAYSGTAAAAFLFGGSATDYYISTTGSDVSLIDHLAWVSTWGGACSGVYPCGTQVDENYVVSTGGFYANPGDTSAYVRDWAGGAQYTNYAFRIAAVPEPASWAMMVAGFGLLGGAMRRRSVKVGFEA